MKQPPAAATGFYQSFPNFATHKCIIDSGHEGVQLFRDRKKMAAVLGKE